MPNTKNDYDYCLHIKSIYRRHLQDSLCGLAYQKKFPIFKDIIFNIIFLMTILSPSTLATNYSPTSKGKALSRRMYLIYDNMLLRNPSIEKKKKLIRPKEQQKIIIFSK